MISSARQRSAAAARAAEFFVMSQLLRQGHEVVPTLGGMDEVELLVKSRSGRRYEVMVRGVADNGRWVVNSQNEAALAERVYVLLNYKRFEEARSYPLVYLLSGASAEALKVERGRARVIAFAGKQAQAAELERWMEAWHLIQ
jgi:hypothetical protein